MQTDISIIIINFNTFQLTCNCIRSVIENTFEINYEIILVDNASTECDAEKFKVLFPKIHLIKSEINLGFSKGNNLGIKNSLSSVILLLNSDTLLKNNAIKICFEYLNKGSNIGVVSSSLLYPDEKLQACCQAFPSIWLSFLEKTRLHKILPSRLRAHIFYGSYFNHKEYAEPDWIWGTFFMFHRKIINDLQGCKLDDSFFMYMEDMMWCYDIRRIGYKIAYIPQAKVIHFMGSSSGKKEEFMKINFNKFLKRNYSLISYLILKK